ncbi:MAG: T9SS type A sorting domain-containing protein [Bacteroidota bacterium]|nr:T9SS type A sorting domain-containing protein [Bacteroidota bacterium]
MKKYLIITLLFISLSDLKAQSYYFGFEWAKQFTGSNIESITGSAIDAQGNVYLAGHFMDTMDANPGPAYYPLISRSLVDCFIIKLTADGVFTWALQYGGNGNGTISANALHIDLFGNLLITGKYADTVDFDPSAAVFKLNAQGTLSDMYVLKLSNDGVFKWAKSFGNPSYESESSNDICSDSMGNVYAVGYFANPLDFNPDSAQFYISPNGDADAFLLKLDSNGLFVRASKVGTNKRAQAVAINKLGQVFYVGASTGGINGYEINVSLIRANGTVQWSRETGSSSHDIAYAIAIDEANNLYLTGHFIGTVSFGVGLTLMHGAAYAPFIWKLDKFGNTIWAIEVSGIWNSVKNAEGNSLCIKDNIIYIAGNAHTLNAQNGFFGKYDTSGVKIFTTVFESTQNANQCSNIKCGNNGSIYVSNNFSKTVDLCPGPDLAVFTTPTIQSYTDGALIRFAPCTPNSDTVTLTVCDAYTRPGGLTYLGSGTYTVWLKNVGGCDSVLILKLTVHQRFLYSTVYKTVCDSFVMPSGKRITNSGMYYDTLPRANTGCDSIFAYYLTINQKSASEIYVNSCGPYTIGSQTYTSPGLYTVHLNNAGGCDSIITLHLSMITIDTGITVQNNILIASDTISSYQWLNCSQQFAPLNGKTSRTFTPTTNGTYAVKLSRNNCTDTSRCVSITVNGNSELSLFKEIKIYPNPTTGVININLEGLKINLTQIVLSDITGRILEIVSPAATNQSLHINGSAGIYFIEIKSSSKSARYKIIKCE